MKKPIFVIQDHSRVRSINDGQTHTVSYSRLISLWGLQRAYALGLVRRSDASSFGSFHLGAGMPEDSVELVFVGASTQGNYDDRYSNKAAAWEVYCELHGIRK